MCVAGDAFHFDSHQSPRVLPAGRRDHTTDLAGGTAPRQVPHIRHDPRLDKVSLQRPCDLSGSLSTLHSLFLFFFILLERRARFRNVIYCLRFKIVAGLSWIETNE